VVEQDPATPSTSAPAAAAPVYKTIKQLRLRSAAAYLPHPEKESYGGEDAHFVSNVSGGAIGVADGGSRLSLSRSPASTSHRLLKVNSCISTCNWVDLLCWVLRWVDLLCLEVEGGNSVAYIQLAALQHLSTCGY